jgi:hypothetical protein
MKLGDFLNSLAAKAGIDPAHKALVDFLSRQEIANIDLSPELTSAIDANLMTLDAAKNNPIVKSHFFANALNGIDTEILNALPEFGFGEDVINEFKNEKNTNSKLRNLVAKVKEAQKNHKDADTSVDKKKYAEEINSLNQKIAGLTDGHTAELNNVKKQHLQEITDMQLNTLLAGKNYANKELPAEVNSTVARTLLNSSLQSKGAKLVNVNGKLVLKRVDDETLDFMDNHKPVTLDGFIDTVLADNKLLAVSTGGQGGQGGSGGQGGQGGNGGQNPPANGSNFGQQLDQLNETLSQFN